MRIVIDMQGAQTESRFRGIGRYSLCFSKAIARNRGDHEVILLLSGLFPDSIQFIRNEFKGILPEESILVWKAVGPVLEELPNNDSLRFLAQSMRELFVKSLNPDVVHITSLFEGYVDDAVTDIGELGITSIVSATLYDLIPLINPDQYLKPNPRYEKYYQRKIKELGKADVLLSISDFARREVIENLKCPESSVVNVSGAVEEKFKPQSVGNKEKERLYKKLGIIQSFILYTGGADERKNLQRLVQAYATLPFALRKEHQLVLAGRMPEQNIFSLQSLGKSLGLSNGELIFTGYISDSDLLALYNNCKLYVFPSWHEGLGLPALEAMSCGAPVIGANTSSLPEIIGTHEALFDPFKIESIAGKIKRVLLDSAFHEKLKVEGLKRSGNFSWDTTAKKAISAWESMACDSKLISLKKNRNWEGFWGSEKSLYSRLIGEVADIYEDNCSLDDVLKDLANCMVENIHAVKDYPPPSFFLDNKITWRVEGPFDSTYSLALVNREVARALEELGVDVALHSTEGLGDFPPDKSFLQKNPDISRMHSRCLEIRDSYSADITSRNLYPPRVSDMNSRLNFLHSYAWEESAFPQDWVEDFNSKLQGVIVTSTHVKKIMIDNGVFVPIAVSGNGVDHWEKISPSNLRVKAKKFRFLHVSSCFPRKGVEVMLDSYGRAFTNLDDVSLIIKTFPNPHNKIHRWLADAQNQNPNYPDVIVVEDDLESADLKALYEQCDALVAPSLAEGFGLPIAEGMLSGLAVITTNWSGQVDFCHPDNSWLVDYQFEYAKTHFHLFNSVWAAPKVEDLSRAMLDVYQTPVNERTEKILKGKNLLLNEYRWSDVAKRMLKFSTASKVNHDTTEVNVGWVSTWNTKCGIAAYSNHLVKNISCDVNVFAPQSTSLQSFDDSNVTRCWMIGETDTLVSLEENIERRRINTLVIQFNYGFFNLDIFSGFLVKQVSLGRTVILMMHSTVDPAHVPHKKLAAIAPALSRCHRILVHAPGDMNRLKAIGLTDNVTLFPHGIPDYLPFKSECQKLKQRVKISSYGFFLPHKGLLELIEAVSLLRDQGFFVELNMINSEYPAKQSKTLIDEARKLINLRGLEEVVTLCSDFLEDSDSLERLSDSDLIVFPYQETAESSSAAVRYGLASGSPVIVTPLPIFSDLQGSVFKFQGFTSMDIAQGIRSTIQDIQDSSVLAKDTISTAKKWVENHRYSNVGRRLESILLSLNANN